MAAEPAPYKHYYVWAEQEADGYRSYVARQDGRPMTNAGAESQAGPISSPDVFDTEAEALEHARSMADLNEA
jgi:hypothetical protein